MLDFLNSRTYEYVKENQWIVEIFSVCANKTIKRVATKQDV